MPGRRLTAALLGAGLLLTGCSGEAADTPGATLPPATAAPTVPRSSAPPGVPAEAQAPTPDGVAAFARYYISEQSAAYETLDPERIRRLSAPGCEACEAFAGSVEAIRDAGGRISDSYRVEILDVVTPGPDPGGQTATVTVILRVGEFVVTAPDGRELAREAAVDQLAQDIRLVRSGDSWLVQSERNA
jgi:hypothetical protein